MLATALRAREPEAPEAAVEKERTKPLRAPLMIVVAARIRETRKIPAVEQIISAGAAAQNILVAAHALGFGGFWRTGAPAYDDRVKEALGLDASDSIVGFLYLGTPAVAASPQPPADLAELVTEWTGPGHSSAYQTRA
jgi:nitroreductase